MIIVDEFQDISQEDLGFLANYFKNPNTKLILKVMTKNQFIDLREAILILLTNLKILEKKRVSLTKSFRFNDHKGIKSKI